MKKPTITEFARMGGKARSAKVTKEKLSEIRRKGGRPRLDRKANSTSKN
jgi:general stress protein YciG